MQLKAVLPVLLVATAAHADGSLSARGVYYKEKSTRVVQPMLDGIFEVGERGLLSAHFLVDAITSASSGSGSANQTPFTERRYEAAAGYTQQINDNFKIGGDGKYSTESDYTSYYVDGRAELLLAQKNAALSVGGSISHDTVTTTMAGGLGAIMLACDPTNLAPNATAPACPLDVYSMYASASQILNRNALVALTYDIADLRGYQANPYRLVVADGLVPERVPEKRLRQAVAASGRYYRAASETTFILAYRFYWDSWNIYAHTPELRVIQQVGDNADATFAYRYYTQTASFFFQPKYAASDPAQQAYLTADPKMSAFTGDTFEAKLGIYGREFGLGGDWAGTRFEGILSYVIQNNRFGNAVIAQAAVTVPFNY